MISISGNANTCRQVSNHSSLRDVTWKTQNCFITFDTIGIWPETVDGIDLTAGCKNATNTLLASGDDFGKVKLYSYPVAWPKVGFTSKKSLECEAKTKKFLFSGLIFNLWRT